MIKIFTNTITRKNYDANGDLFPEGRPQIFLNGSDTVAWQLCSATPDIASETGQKPEDVWTKCTQYADYNAIGALLTADNDYVKRLQGTLSVAVSAGSVSQITATIADASLSTIPSSGTVSLFDTAGNIEVFEYDAIAISGTTVVFSLATGSEAENSYAQGAQMDCVQAVLLQSALDTVNSDVSNGLFVFQVTADSRKLHDMMAYQNIKSIDVMGLELAIYNVDSENSEVVDLERYEVDTFSIRSGIADTAMDAQVTTQRQSQAVEVMVALLASGYSLQFSADAENWHTPQVAATDNYFRFRSTGAGGTWSAPIRMPEGANAMVWAEGTDEQVALLGGMHSAKVWAGLAAGGVALTLVTSTAATLSPTVGNAYDWTPAGDAVIEFNAAELSGQYVGVPIHIHPAVGASITGSTETGKAVTLSQEITGEGWFMLAWDGTTATLYAYAGIPGIDGGDIDPQQE